MSHQKLLIPLTRTSSVFELFSEYIYPYVGNLSDKDLQIAVINASTALNTPVSVFKNINGEYIRIATTMQLFDGKYAIGTKLSNQTVIDTINKGETFTGVTEVFGKPYSTVYKPIISGEYVLYIGIEL